MDWLAQLPEEIRGNDTLKGFTDVGSLAKAHIDLSTKSASGLYPLQEGAKPEDIEAHEKAVAKFFGVPEKIEDYKIDKPKLADGITWGPSHDEDFKGLLSLAHKAKLSPKQTKIFVDAYGEQTSNFHREAAKASQDAVGKLKAELGTKYDEVEGNIGKFLVATGGKELAQLLKDIGDLHHPVIFKWLAKLAPLFGEDGMPSGGKPPGGMSGDEVQARLNRLYPSHAK